MKTRVKVAVQMKAPGVPGWPCINYDYDRELARREQEKINAKKYRAERTTADQKDSFKKEK